MGKTLMICAFLALCLFPLSAQLDTELGTGRGTDATAGVGADGLAPEPVAGVAGDWGPIGVVVETEYVDVAGVPALADATVTTFTWSLADHDDDGTLPFTTDGVGAIEVVLVDELQPQVNFNGVLFPIALSDLPGATESATVGTIRCWQLPSIVVPGTGAVITFPPMEIKIVSVKADLTTAVADYKQQVADKFTAGWALSDGCAQPDGGGTTTG